MATTATPSPARLRSLYRSLLRELPPRPILATPRSPIQTRLRASFTNIRDPEASKLVTANSAPVAEQLVTYLRSQRTYATLLERYNPGMDMADEERVRLSARRVGMNMPVSYTAEGEAK